MLDPPTDWQPPAALEDFLETGPLPVYVGFGSMPSQRPEDAAAMVVEALQRNGLRGVLYGGWGGLRPEDLPEQIYVTGPVPHNWLFPRMAAIVHHGGAGTTAAGLWAGVPNIVTPFFGDQPFWGRQVHALGVGPQPIPRSKLTVDNLSEALHTVTTDTQLRERAAALGQRIRAEDGVARAVELIGSQTPLQRHQA